ncbi:MAG: PKD domain-containing protein [Chitinophagales bacterium]
MRNLLLLLITLFIFNTAYADCDLSPKFSYATKGLKVSFDNKSKGDYNEMEWQFGDGTTSFDNHPKHTYEEAGIYVFSLTISNNEGCSETFEGKVYVFNIQHKRETKPVEEEVVEHVNVLASLSNYPNPVSTHTTMSFEVSESADVQINLYDMMGRLIDIVMPKQNVYAGRHELTYYRRNYILPGTYLITAISDNRRWTRKMIVQ